MKRDQPMATSMNDWQTPSTRRRLLGMLSLGAAGVGLTGCAGARLGSLPRPVSEGSGADLPDIAARFAEFEPDDEPNGDLAKVVWPDWMARLDPEVKRLYEFQILNGPLMRYMPCFCGCQWEDGHRSNRDCYVEAVNPDGSVVFDSMAPT